MLRYKKLLQHLIEFIIQASVNPLSYEKLTLQACPASVYYICINPLEIRTRHMKINLKQQYSSALLKAPRVRAGSVKAGPSLLLPHEQKEDYTF